VYFATFDGRIRHARMARGLGAKALCYWEADPAGITL
jgi:hypothetical protein